MVIGSVAANLEIDITVKTKYRKSSDSVRFDISAEYGLNNFRAFLKSRLSHFRPGRGLPSGADPRSSAFPAGSDIGNRAQGRVGVARPVTVVHAPPDHWRCSGSC